MLAPGPFGQGYRHDDPDDDDDFEDVPEESTSRKIGVAVAIAGLSAFVVKLVEWGIEKLREKVDPAESDEDQS